MNHKMHLLSDTRGVVSDPLDVFCESSKSTGFGRAPKITIVVAISIEV